MKFKTFRKKDTKEYVHLFETIKGTFTADMPQILPITAKFETICILFPNINLSNSELIEIDVIDSEEIGADIRNKLSPLKNLLSLFKERDKYTNDSEIYNKLTDVIYKEIDQCEISIDYLANLL